MEFIDLKTQQSRIRARIDASIAAVLDHGRYIMGPEIDELEQRLADFTGVDHCVTVASGTDSLLIALMALGVGPGDEVITTAFSFIATAEVILLAGATPVFVDIDPVTYNLVPEGVAAAISKKTKAILPVSLYGQCADMRTINEIADRYGLPVIEDAAQSFGAKHHSVRSCALSTVGSTSFFPSKPLGCYGDGGALFTNDGDLANRMRQIRVHGQDRRYHHPHLGINGRMDTLQAAILLAKLEIFEDEVGRREQIGRRYSELLHSHVNVPVLAPGNTSVYGQYTVRVANREKFIEKMTAQGIPTAVHYPIALHRQPVFAHLQMREDAFPAALKASNEVVSLPMHPYLDDDQIERVVQAVISAAA